MCLITFSENIFLKIKTDSSTHFDYSINSTIQFNSTIQLDVVVRNSIRKQRELWREEARISRW